MPDDPWSRICRALLVISSLGLLAFAAGQIWLTARYTPYLRLSTLMARGQPVSDDAVLRFSADLPNRPVTCRSDIVEAEIAVRLQQVEIRRRIGQVSGGDEAWKASVRALAPALDHALSCLPTDSRLWQRRAVLTWLLGGPVSAQIADMQMSQAYGPADLDAIALRLSHWKRVGPSITGPADSAIRSDIRNLLEQAPIAQLSALLSDLPPELDRIVADTLTNLAPARRAQLSDKGFPKADVSTR